MEGIYNRRKWSGLRVVSDIKGWKLGRFSIRIFQVTIGKSLLVTKTKRAPNNKRPC